VACGVDDEANDSMLLLLVVVAVERMLVDSIVSILFALLLSGEIVVSQWTMSFCKGFESARLADELDDGIDAVIDDDEASTFALFIKSSRNRAFNQPKKRIGD